MNKKVVILDFLDLFVKYECFKNRTNLNEQSKKHELTSSDNRLPACFSYYWHSLRQNDDSGVDIVLNNGYKMNKNDHFVNIQLNKLGEQENQDLIQKNYQSTLRIDQCVSLFTLSILQNTVLENIFREQTKNVENNNKSPNKEKPDVNYQITIVINMYGFQTNSFLVSLSNIKQSISNSSLFNSNSLIKIKKCQISFVNSTTSLALYFYKEILTTTLTQSIIIASLDFGARGISFSILKLYPSIQNVIQVLNHFTDHFGGININQIIIDLITEHVKLHKGVNIKSTPEMIEQLYQLAEQTKISISEAEQVFIRIQGYPLQQSYGFYLKRVKLELKIREKFIEIINNMSEMYSKYMSKDKLKEGSWIKHVIVSGGSFNIPLFKTKFFCQIIEKYQQKQNIKTEVIYADKNWIAKGNYLYKQSGVIVLQKSIPQLYIRGINNILIKLSVKKVNYLLGSLNNFSFQEAN